MILRACLEKPKSLGRTSHQQVAEFLVYRRCDVSKLSAERIAALKSERDALAAFRNELEELARTLPPTMYSEPHLESRLNDLVNDIVKRWQADQANLSSYARALFGEGVLAEPAKLIKKLAESAATPIGAESASVAAAGSAVAVAGAHVGNLTIGLAAGAAAGFAVAVVFRAIGTWGKIKTREKQSPFRYLTTLARNGVVFSMSQ